MKQIFSGTVAAFVLGAAIASSQTPPAQPPAPAPAPAQPSAGQAQPAEPRATAAAPRTTTYKGILKGSAASGWTLAPIRSTTGTPGATATSGADAVTYSIVTGDAAKVDLDSMADKCVEVAGVLAPEARPSGDAAKAANRTFTVATIKAAEGCK